MATGINSQLNTQKEKVVSSTIFTSSLFFCSPRSENPNSPSVNSHLLFILQGKCTPSSLLLPPFPYMYFICEVERRKEITRSSRTEMGGGQLLLFYFKDDKQPEESNIERPSCLGSRPESNIKVFFYGATQKSLVSHLFVLRFDG